MKFLTSNLKKFLEFVWLLFLSVRNKLFLKKMERDFKKFCDGLGRDYCCICRYPISHVNYKKPCLHWLLRPNGIDKKHIQEILIKSEYSRVEAFIKWAANCEMAFGNINDLVEDGQSQKVIEFTTKYKNIEWSVSSAVSDFEGHKGSQYGAHPHYHFQMRIDGDSFFDYNDMHVPFKGSDLLMFRMRNDEFSRVKWVEAFGMGMDGVMREFSDEKLVSMMGAGTEDVEKAIFRTQTLITAKEGEVIQGEEILRILEESESKNVSMGSMAKTMKGVGNVEYFVSPGEGIPKKAKRKPGRGGKRK